MREMLFLSAISAYVREDSLSGLPLLSYFPYFPWFAADGRGFTNSSGMFLMQVPSIAENAVSRVKRQNCGPLNFECQNGECIEGFKICDGAIDCSDGSDENQVTCKQIRCPDDSFRCAYGACVDDIVRCDGIVHCKADGSDEAPELCGSSVAPKCTLPLKHNNGGYRVLGCDTQHCGFEPGAQVPSGTQLEFFCDEGYHINGPSTSYCVDRAFTPPPPVCEKTECPPLVYDSLYVQCYLSTGHRIPCYKPMAIGSKAQLACKPYYTKTVEFYYPDLTCTHNGTWDKQPFTCVPECGKSNPTFDTFLPAGEFPWHVGIYLLENGKFEQKCGGTIIKRKLVLTAAHCFVHSENPKDYRIAAGKYHRGWDTDDPTQQRFEVESIEIKDTYRGATRNYADDIAIVVLKTEVTISGVVRPVCVDLEGKYESEQLSPGTLGLVARWGYTESGAPSDELLTTKLPFVEFTECYGQLPISFRSYFTTDKFCAGFTNGSAVCQGDNGGGLSFEQQVTATTKQWFVQGIVSLGVPSREGKVCPSRMVLFTRVSSHLSWLKIYYDKY